MNATCINNLVQAIPHEAVADSLNYSLDECELEDFEASRFAAFYGKVSFGWLYAQMLAKFDMEFPCSLEGNDDWIFRAYLTLVNPKKYRDPVMTRIKSLCAKNMRTTRMTLDAILLVQGMTPAMAAEHLDPMMPIWTPEVIEGYEKLFFNVLDRRQDGAYIQQIVYNETRYVEMLDNYLQSEDVRKLLMRTGHNNDIDDVLFFSGLSNNTMRRNQAPDIAEKLEASIMAHGYMMARNGFMNQSANAAGMYHARSLLQAAKQGGEDGQHESPMTGIGESLLADMQRVKLAESKAAIQFMNGHRQALPA